MLTTIVSCIKNVDFDQANDITITPVVKSTLIHFDITESNFNTTNYKTDISEFQIFENGVAQHNTVKMDFLFDMENTFNKDINILYQFLDENLNIVGSINLVSEHSTDKIETVTFENNDLNDLLNTKSIQVTISISDTVNLTPEMYFNFKSALHIHLKI